MITVTLANQKGGVAKTTSAISVIHGLTIKGYSDPFPIWWTGS